MLFSEYLQWRFERKIQSLRTKIRVLPLLQDVLKLDPQYDLTDRQWKIITSQLRRLETRINQDLDRTARKNLPLLHLKEAVQALNSDIGKLKLELSKAFVIYDLYLDLLSQRLAPKLGGLLAGCDKIALNGLRRNHPALKIIGPPLVFLDRGLGASILRTGKPLPGGSSSERIRNELPLIQIPYNRITDKIGLSVGIFHEVGHEALVRLKIESELRRAIYDKFTHKGIPKQVIRLFVLTAKEIGPDFWAFCNCGIAQTFGIKEILSLPPNLVFKVSLNDPHPPPLLRILISIAFCKKIWGNGIWDIWEKEWYALYPLEKASKENRKILSNSIRYLGLLANVLFETKFATLNGKTIPSMFNLDLLNPRMLEIYISKFLDLGKIPTDVPLGVQLAVFRLMVEKRVISERRVDQLLSQWFKELVAKRISKASLLIFKQKTGLYSKIKAQPHM